MFQFLYSLTDLLLGTISILISVIIFIALVKDYEYD